MSGDPQWIQRLDALYGFALRLYPRSFRATWEQPMRQAFRDRCREIARGQRRPTALLTELLPDFALGLGRERIHDLGEGSMSRRQILLAMLVLLAAAIALHDRIGIAANAAIDGWKAHRAQVRAEAERNYWDALARAMAPAATPRDHTVAAIAWQMAGLGSALLPANSDAKARAQQSFDAAIAGRDPAALWLAATDCPAQACDRDAAIAELQRLDPGNAAVGLVAMSKSPDAGTTSRLLSQLASSQRYHGYDADLMQSLLQVDTRARAPRHASADDLVAGMAMAWVIPDPRPLLDACRPGLAAAEQCRALAQVLASGNSLVARSVGLRIWNRFAATGTDAGEVHRRIRNLHWLVAHLPFPVDEASRNTWRKAWLAGEGEVAVYQSWLVQRGIPLEAPSSFAVDPRYLDPSR